MFFKDDNGAQGVMFGESKVIVANYEVKAEEGVFAGILLGEEIEGADPDTTKVKAKMRMVFQNAKDVNLVIAALERAKDAIRKREVFNIIVPGDN